MLSRVNFDCSRGAAGGIVIGMIRRNPLRVAVMSAVLAPAAAALCLYAQNPATAPAGTAILGLADELAPPVQVRTTDGKAIDLFDAVGHAAPFFGDIDGDGANDLLVGQFAQGQLRIYKNTGSTREPAFDSKYTWFKAGADLGRVPSG
jgi:hypothetical protein